MAKIFDWDGRKGTLIDSVSKIAGTLTAGTGGFKKTEKGLAMKSQSTVTNIIYSGINPKGLLEDLDFTVRIDFKTNDLTDGLVGYIDTAPRFYIRCLNATTIRFGLGDDVGDFTVPTMSLNKWYHLVLTFDWSAGTINCYLDNVYANTSTSSDYKTNLETDDLMIGRLDGYISNVQIYDTVLTQTERNELYKEFLNSYGTEEQKRNFTYPKPTDLSKEVDSVVGSQLVTNGDFSDGTTGWTSVTSNLSVESGALKVTQTSGSTAYAYQGFTTVIGKKYRVNFQNKKGSDTDGRYIIGNSYNVGTFYDEIIKNDDWADYSVTFTATATTTYVALTSYSADTNYQYYDNVVVQELTGLVAAYNFDSNSVKGGVMTDISGNGNSMTLVNSVLTSKNGLLFNTGSAGIITKTMPNDSTMHIVFDKFDGADYSYAVRASFGGRYYLRKTSAITFGFNIGNPEISLSNNLPVISNQLNVFSIQTRSIAGQLAARIFVNGLLTVDWTNFSGVPGSVIYINTNSATPTNGFTLLNIIDFQIYDYTLTETQEQAYHNSFIKPTLIEDFSNYPVGKIITSGRLD